jgi:DNA polymerase elongation subunit (family B)
MSSLTCFVYDWSTEIDGGDLLIRAFALDEHGASYCLSIRDFQPHIYVELPSDRQWTSAHVDMLDTFFVKRRVFDSPPESRRLVRRRKLYGAHVHPDTLEAYAFPYVLYKFKTHDKFHFLPYKFKEAFKVYGLGTVQLHVHEFNIPVHTQLANERDIPLAGWIHVKGRAVAADAMETACDHEFQVSYKSMTRAPSTAPPAPTVLSFDIETNSSNPKVIPSPTNPDDCIFQISAVCWGAQRSLQKYLFTLGKPDPVLVGDDTVLRTFDFEYTLLLAFIELVHEWNPQVFTGYNIFGFDLPYLLGRAEHNRIKTSFKKIGMIRGKECKDTKPRKEAMNASDRYLETEGRLWIDLLHLIKRDYKFANNRLETVAHQLLNAGKDPITHHDIFYAYKEGVVKKTPEGIEMLGRVGHYCVVDSELVQRLFTTLDVWVGIVEMAAVCHVTPSIVFLRGQQSKVFAQVCKYCWQHGFVVENMKSHEASEDMLKGATVMQPVPGIYKDVISHDFNSLYPSMIIAYNIDYSTLVPDDMKISPDKCHVVEWAEHVSCEHTAHYDLLSKDYRCESHKYRFLKSPLGVLPTLIQDLLAMRKQTRAHAKTLKAQGELTAMERMLVSVLGQRQLSYKVSANSIYGTLGAKNSYLPFLIGAMCVTAMGRKSWLVASNYLQKHYGTVTVYGDTDSVYSRVPHITDPMELWAYAEYIQRDLLEKRVFPEPMQLEFEGAVYADFLILSKKRYMWRELNRDTGTVGETIGRKGVLLVRRDTSKFARDVYEIVVQQVFHGKSCAHILLEIQECMLKCFRRQYAQDAFVITKSVREDAAYTVRALTNNPEKRQQRLTHLKCTEEGYNTRALPAHVQLAIRLRSRGVRVDPGQRLEYVIVKGDKGCTQMFDKIEDKDYQAKYARVVPLDYVQYLKSICVPMDELLEVAFGRSKLCTWQYKVFRQYQSVVSTIDALTSPRVVCCGEQPLLQKK